MHEAHNIRKSKGMPKELSPGQWSELWAFDKTVRHFALALRELAKCIRVGSDPCIDQGDNEKFNSSHEARSLIPLYIDLAFVYARRLADHFARAGRYVLFKFPGSAPKEYKNLRLVIADRANLLRLEPICDADILQRAFERHSGWLDNLRDSTAESGALQKGVRDIMEHHPVAVMVHHSKAGDGPWEVLANLGEPGINASFRSGLISTLNAVVADMAGLWTMVCDSVGLQPAERLWVAPYGDALLLTGNDDDSTAFWPESQA
jgi:hypothetical protein